MSNSHPLICPNCGWSFKRLFTYAEAAFYSAISVRRLRERVRENRIPFKKEGTAVLLDALPTENAVNA
jgi:hypothetical protein